MSLSIVTEADQNVVAIGGWATLADPLAIETLASVGFDFIGLDLQHGQFGQSEAARAIQILALVGVPTMVRLSSEELGTAPRYLDFGAHHLMVATVDDAVVARRAVSLSMYQPHGTRSFGGQRFGLGAAITAPPRVWVMIETLKGLHNLAEIAAVPGLYGLAVGPADLAHAYGTETSEMSRPPEWHEAIRQVVAASARHGLRSCQFAGSGAEVAEWARIGFDHVVLSNDLDLLRSGAGAQLSEARRTAS